MFYMVKKLQIKLIQNSVCNSLKSGIQNVTNLKYTAGDLESDD